MLNGKKFGIEIEFLMPNRFSYEAVARALTDMGIRCKYNPNYGRHDGGDAWLMGKDGSVGDIAGYSGGELVSPPLNDERGFEHIRKALNLIQKTFKAQVNHTCGLHVHHEWPQSYDKNKMGEFFLKYQDALYEVVKNARARRGSYSGKIHGGEMEEVVRHSGHHDIRRRGINFGPCNKGHIEFRLHHGSTRFAEIRNWIILTQRVVQISQTHSEAPLLAQVRAKLAKSMYSVNELHRELSNGGVDVKKTELKKLLGGFLSIKFDDGETRYSSAQHKTKTAELLEVLGFDKDEITTFFLGKEGLKKILEDVI